MVIAKGLIFKSLLGIATSGVVIVPIVLTKLSNKKTEEDSDVENGKSEEGSNGIISGSNQGVSDVSSSQITVNTESQQTTSPGNGSNSERGVGILTNTPTQPEEVDTLGIPKSCTTKCQLTDEQLKNLKFEPKTTGASLTVEGLSGNSTVDLIVEDKQSDKTNYPKGKKYTLKSTTGKVTIKGVKDGDIVLENNKDVVIREKQSGGKLEKVPEAQKPKIESTDALGIPKNCTNTCKLTSDQLKNLKFEQKGKDEITVDGLTGNNTVDLTVTTVSNDPTNYPKGKKYTLKTTTGTVKIKGVKDGDITIEKSKDVVIRETSSGGKLEKAPEEVDNLGIPKSCTTKAPCQLTKEQLQRFKFEQGGSSITIEGLSGNNKVELTVADITNDKDNYPKNKKYTLKATSGDVTIKNTQDGNIILKKDKGVDFREKSTGGKLETVLDLLGIPKSCTTGSPCQLTQEQLGKIKFEPKNSGGSISVSGLTSEDKVTLTISDESSSAEKTNYPKGKKYNFKTSPTKTATIAGAKEDISITSTGINFREKTTGGQLEKVPETKKPPASETDSLGLPNNCEVNKVTSSTKTKSCELTEEQLKKVKFKDFDGKSGATTVTGLTAPNNKIKLTISWDDDKSDYPDNKKYSFDNSSNNSDVKITKEKKDVTIAKKTESWFKNEGNKLSLFKTKLGEEKENVMKNVNGELTILGLSEFIKLTIDDFKKDDKANFEQKTLELDKDTMKKIQFKALEGTPTSIDWGDESKKVELKLNYTEDSSNYPKNMKFSLKNNSNKDVTIRSGQKSFNFPSNQCYTFKVSDNELEKTTTG